MPNSKGLRLVFAGTPDFAAKHLDALFNSPHEVVAVYTQPDRPAGRGKKLTPSPVKLLAEKHEVSVLQPVSLKFSDAQQQLQSLEPDIIVVVAYGLLLPKAVLDIPKFGCINVHGSILPRWRGAAPIQRAIEAGDSHSGVTIMQMDVGLDTGDMLLKAECPILPNDTSADLHDRLCEIGPPTLLKCLNMVANGTLKSEAQDDAYSSYAKKIYKQEARIDWRQSAEHIHRQIRAFSPFPVCHTQLGDSRLRIHQASVEKQTNKWAKPGTITTISDTTICVQCGDGSLLLERVQLPGKKVMAISQFLNGFGHLVKKHEILGTVNTECSSAKPL